MELVEGEDLSQRIARGAIPLDEALPVAKQIADALEASHDYDPGPGLEKIRAPLVAVNSADDLINPPELGILEREIKRVPHGRAVVIPLSDRTAGHQTHSLPAIWKGELERLLRESASTNDVGAKVSN